MDTRGKPVRVTFLIGSLDVGGAETQLVRLANGLDRTRYKASIICLWQGGELEDAVEPHVRVTQATLVRESSHPAGGRTVLAVRILASMMNVLRRDQPDIVHAFLPAAYVLGGLAAWMLRVPVIIGSRRGLTSYEGSRRWLSLIANRVIDLQICNAEAVRQWAITKEGLGIERTRVIHNGIDVPSLIAPPQLPAEWGSEGGRAAMVANLIRYKGHREVLQAVKRVVDRHESFKLVLFGEGDERAAVTDLARELGIAGNVTFAGMRRDAADLLQGFDFTVLGSSQEGFPNAVMESMARAVPVVATTVGGVPELITDGIHGRLVPYGDPAAMAEAIAWMIEHPEERRRMGLKARERVAEEFSTDRMVRETQAVYEELLSKRKPMQAQ